MPPLTPSCSSTATALVLTAAAALAQGPPPQSDGTSPWNQFRGPNGTGLAASGSYPADVGPKTNVIWKRTFPTGHSSPVFSATHVFLTAVDDEKLWTYALDRETGRTVWRREAPRPRRTKFHGKNGPAAASAAVDDDTIVVFFDEFGALAYDHAGNERWRLPLGPFHNVYGMGASPILADGLAILPCDDGKDSFVMGVDKHSGEVRWRTARPDAVSGHCTPVLWQPEDSGKQFLLAGSFLLDAYDVATGERVWWIRGLPGEMKSVPVLLGDTLWIHGFASPINNKGRQVDLPEYDAALAKFDADGNDAIAIDELKDRRARGYAVYVDFDGDKVMNQREWRFLRLSLAAVNAALAIKVGGKGDMTDENVLWRYYRSIPQLPSPLIANGTYYLAADQGGLVTALKSASGELIDKSRVGPAGDACFASPVAGDGKVYLLSEAGVLTVLAAGENLEAIHTADFGETCFATPALVDGRIWLRTEGHLYCLGQ
ncbi:MAG: PQQ-binding-like beta-propeller repeat protein [bacterium]|nr:PQQ-binding-like beta-propeller repeat protein [bacterium]